MGIWREPTFRPNGTGQADSRNWPSQSRSATERCQRTYNALLVDWPGDALAGVWERYVGFASIEPSTADPAGPMEARRLSTQMRPISLEAQSENPSRLRRSAVMAVFRSQVAGSSV